MNYFAFGIPVSDILGILGLILVVILVVFLVTTIFQWLWNITMPEVFRMPFITFWQAFRILIIASILFGGSPFRYNHNETVDRTVHTTPPPPAIYIGQPPYELKK